MSFSDRLKELRTEKGLSQNTLAGLADVSQAAIYQWEKGTRTPKIEQIKKLAFVLGVSADYLMGYSEHRKDLINKNPILKAFDSEELQNGIGKDLLDHIELESLNITEDKRELIFNYNQLNESGQKEALKRVQELTEVPRYQRKEETE